jgi:hypothetical protein
MPAGQRPWSAPKATDETRKEIPEIPEPSGDKSVITSEPTAGRQGIRLAHVIGRLRGHSRCAGGMAQSVEQFNALLLGGV